MKIIKNLFNWIKRKIHGELVIGWDVGSNDKSVVMIGRIKNGVIKIVDVRGDSR